MAGIVVFAAHYTMAGVAAVVLYTRKVFVVETISGGPSRSAYRRFGNFGRAGNEANGGNGELHGKGQGSRAVQFE